ncbi:pentalenene synthase [Hyaloscypha finlandica]|nr:pentalenene synthase [Hyaloscypha finlandica]
MPSPRASIASVDKVDTAEIIKIPDIFELFMSRPPTLNPLYKNVRVQALEWASKMCHYNKQEVERMRRGDFAFFAAISVPDAEASKLRTVTDWLNWVFVFDDQLDDGPLGRKEKAAEALDYIDSMAAILDGENRSESDMSTQPLRNVLKSIWGRVNAVSTCISFVRWKQNMKYYLAALRASINYKPSTTLEETIKGYIDYRFHSIGVLPLFTFVEYACGLEIPDEVFEDSFMHEIQRIGIRLIVLTANCANDCVSYHREKDNGCPHNIIHLLRHHGLSEQEFYDRVQTLLRQRYKQWYLAHAHLPTWGEQTDREVQRYIKGIEDVALANAHWSFRTERYFGKNREQVRKTREVPSGKVDWLPAILMTEK